MTRILFRTARISAIAGAALLAAACGGDGDEAANQAMANEADANLMLNAPANDASALESAINAAEPTIGENGSQGTDAVDVLGNTSGGDTGGNTAESNVSGM